MEAALLMGVLIPLLVGVIYLGFFMMIRGNVQGEAIEKALTALLIGEETEGVSLGEKEVSVEAEAAVPAFPFGKACFFSGGFGSGAFCAGTAETVGNHFPYAQSEKSDKAGEEGMKPSYRKEKDNDYMILEAPGKPEGGEYQIRMLLVNPIYGLLPCKMRMVDGSRAFYYDITEKQPMTSVFERRLMGKEDIEKLLGGLEKAMDEAGRYLLVMEQFILKPEYIFQDTETGEFFFCYLPFYDGSLETDFRELAEYILKRLDHSQEEAVLWGYDIYSRSAEEHFSIGKILESVHERAAKEAVRKSREKSPEKMRQTAPREERQKPVEELEYIEVEEGASEETARPAAGVRRAGLWKKQLFVREKQRIQKKLSRERSRRNGTPKQEERPGRQRKRRSIFLEKSRIKISKTDRKKARAEKV